MVSLPTDLSEALWSPTQSVVFRKTTEAWGGLSNMAPGFTISVGSTTFLTSEALYQAMRFPGRPDVQEMIIEQGSPMTAKMKSKKFRREDSHPQWDSIRVAVMHWCLELKLAQNWTIFGELLRSTEPLQIVEHSSRDCFWGAVPHGDFLKGSNVLGRLLMSLRDSANLSGAPPDTVHPPGVALRLLGQSVPTWLAAPSSPSVAKVAPPGQQGHLDFE